MSKYIKVADRPPDYKKQISDAKKRRLDMAQKVLDAAIDRRMIEKTGALCSACRSLTRSEINDLWRNNAITPIWQIPEERYFVTRVND